MACNFTPNFTCANPDNENGFCEDLLVDGSFEQGNYTAGLRPTAAGFWQGDLAAVVTEGEPAAASSGIRPCDGARMLKFRGSEPGGAAVGGVSAVFQLVDLGSFSGVIEAGGVKVVARALFDRVQVDAETDRQFSLVVAALEGTLASFPTQWRQGTSLELARRTIQTNSVAGWQELVVELELPVNTDYIVVVYSADETVFDDDELPEYDGHFVDGVRVQLSR